jgi:hypothetical protein
MTKENGSANGPWHFNISGWNGGDIEDYQEAAKSGSMKAIREFLIEKRVITSWTFEGDPADAEAWRSLEPKQYQEALKAADKAIGDIFQ